MGRVAYVLGSNSAILFGLLIAFGIVPIFSGQQHPPAQPQASLKPYTDKDAYAIYAVLLVNEGTADPLLVIQAETESHPASAIEIKGDSEFYKVWQSVLNDYDWQNRNQRRLARNIPIQIPYESVPGQQLLAVVHDLEAWQNVHPFSAGFFSLSAVGFDAQKTHAVVYATYTHTLFGGGSSFCFFEKTNGKWRKASVKASFPVTSS
jgi:hypothetical protein